MFSIYAIREPETGEIRYFGKTLQEPKDRFQAHLSAKPFWKVSKWIQELKQAGKMPVLEVLMTGLTAEEASEEEIALIAWGRAKGLNLTNSANGGGGPVEHYAGRKLTDAEKQHLREVNTGKRLSPETKKKIGDAEKGEKHWTFGKARTVETRQKISESLSGENHPYWGKERSGIGAGAERSDNTSGFVGVSWDKSKKRWMAYINYAKKRKFLGRFRLAEDAARAYDAAAIQIYGEFAKVNFPKFKDDISR